MKDFVLFLRKNPNAPRRAKPGSTQSLGPVSGVDFVCDGEYTVWPLFCWFVLAGAVDTIGVGVGVGQNC